jgi:hypothetical protein
MEKEKSNKGKNTGNLFQMWIQLYFKAGNNVFQRAKAVIQMLNSHSHHKACMCTHKTRPRTEQNPQLLLFEANLTKRPEDRI